MKPIDIIVIAVILVIIGGAIFYMIKAKKRGQKCIGCPYAKNCSSNEALGSCCAPDINKNE